MAKICVCNECEGWSIWAGSNGVCRACRGSGRCLQLNHPGATCNACGGTGVCPACQGHCLVVRDASPADRDRLDRHLISRSRFGERFVGALWLALWLFFVLWRLGVK
jgi:hypothetical protein